MAMAAYICSTYLYTLKHVHGTQVRIQVHKSTDRMTINILRWFRPTNVRKSAPEGLAAFLPVWQSLPFGHQYHHFSQIIPKFEEHIHDIRTYTHLVHNMHQTCTNASVFVCILYVHTNILFQFDKHRPTGALSSDL